MYRTSTTYPDQIWISQGAINSSDLRDQKIQVEQWTSRRVPYLGRLPFTDKYTKNWNQEGKGRDENVDEKRKRADGEVYEENYVERVEKVGEGVQAKGETENE